MTSCPISRRSITTRCPQELKHYNGIETRNRDKNYFLYMYLARPPRGGLPREPPDWDGKTLVVMGTSMGGQQSLCTAGLHPKVTAMLINVPAGADANWHRAWPQALAIPSGTRTIRRCSRPRSTSTR